MKRYFLALAIVVLFPAISHAQIVFSEIMYDASGTDTDHEWVEIQNTGTSSVDLTGWKFNDGSNHTLNAPPTNGSTGSLTLAAGGYLILTGDATQFLVDHSGYSGSVIDTVMSLNNTGDTLTFISVDGATADTVTYQSSLGAGGDGNSLQKIAGTWIPAVPTPGAENTATSSSTTTTASAAPSINTEEQKVQKSDFIPLAYDGEILTKTTSMTGVPLDMSVLVRDQKQHEILSGVYVWSFGDGTASTIEGDGGKVTHTFSSAGDYVVYAEYYNYHGEITPDDIDRVVVHVVDPLVQGSIASDGTYHISSLAKTELDLGGWTIYSGGVVVYTVPKHTVLLPGKTLILSAGIFPVSLDSTSYLATSTGMKIGEQSHSSVRVTSSYTRSRSSSVSTPSYSSTQSPSTNVLTASASSAFGTDTASATSSRVLSILGLIAILVTVAGVGLWYVRRLRVWTALQGDGKVSADEFELVE